MSMLTSDDEEGLDPDPVDIVGFQKDLFSSIVEGLESQEVEKKMWAIYKLRILFNDDVTFLVHALKSGKVVPLLDKILFGEDSSALKLEAANAVMDTIPELMLSADEVMDTIPELKDVGGDMNTIPDIMVLDSLVIDIKLVELLLKLLNFPDEYVCERAMEKLRIVALSPKGRGSVLTCTALDSLLRNLTCRNTLFLRKATKTILVLSRGTPKVPSVKVKPAIRALCSVVTSNYDQEVLKNACWAIYYLSGGIDKDLEAYCDSKSSISRSVVSQSDIIGGSFQIPVLLKPLEDPSPSVIAPAIHILSSICRGDDGQKEELMKACSTYKRDVLSCLSDLLDRRTEERLVCLCIAYITLGSRQRAKAVADAAGLMDRLCQLAKAWQMDVAAAAISNAIIGISDDSYINELVDCCIGPLCDYLGVFGNKIICTISLKGVENILEHGEKHKGSDDTNIYAKRIKEAGGFKNLNDMCRSSTMGRQAREILSKYWPANGTSCKGVPITIPHSKNYYSRRRERGSKICAALTSSNFSPA